MSGQMVKTDQGLHCLPFQLQMSRHTTKPTKWHVRPTKTQISLGIHPVWSESSLSAWRHLGSLATPWAQVKTLIRLGGCPGWSESSLGAHVILLVLSWGGSYLGCITPWWNQTCSNFRIITAIFLQVFKFSVFLWPLFFRNMSTITQK